jgi:hypothetical protein
MAAGREKALFRGPFCGDGAKFVAAGRKLTENLHGLSYLIAGPGLMNVKKGTPRGAPFFCIGFV